MTSNPSPHPGDKARPWAAVVAALGLLGVLGAAILDDYGVSIDARLQRHHGHATLELARGDDTAFRERLEPIVPEARYFGAAFEAPLALVERALGQADGREVYLTRHLLTHLAFLVGAGAAALLARRLFGGLWPALFALTAFALHPRLYAHSFFNSKDAPFAALFMVCLCLAERAFRRGTAGAFALLGAGVGVLVNLRVMGALLFAAVLGLRALDVALARGFTARCHALTTGAAFAAAAAATLYAVSPHLWPDPALLMDSIALYAQHPNHVSSLFAGAVVRWPDIPAGYVPTWVAIATPPALLALCLAGAAAALGRGLVPLAGAVRAAPPRFGLLLVACPALTIAAVVAVNANVYDGWRHLHFLWAPASLLAVGGARWLAGAGRRRWLRRIAVGLAATGVAAGATQTVLLHPQQWAYFNLLVDRDAPERLATWYEIDTWRLSPLQGLKRTLDAHPGAVVRWTLQPEHGTVIHGSERHRLVSGGPRRLAYGGQVGAADLVLDQRHPLKRWPWTGPPFAPTTSALWVYDNTLVAATMLNVSLVGGMERDAWRAEYRAAAAVPPLARSEYDLHLRHDGLMWLKAPCGAADTAGEFTFTAWPADGGASASSACGFARCGVRVDGACMVRTSLPQGGGGAEVHRRRAAAAWWPAPVAGSRGHGAGGCRGVGRAAPGTGRADRPGPFRPPPQRRHAHLREVAVPSRGHGLAGLPACLSGRSGHIAGASPGERLSQPGLRHGAMGLRADRAVRRPLRGVGAAARPSHRPPAYRAVRRVRQPLDHRARGGEVGGSGPTGRQLYDAVRSHLPDCP